MSMLFEVGDFFPEIKIHKEMKNFLMTNQGSKLYIKINTGQVDQFVLLNLKGLALSKAKPKHIFRILDSEVAKSDVYVDMFSHMVVHYGIHDAIIDDMFFVAYQHVCYLKQPPHTFNSRN